MSVPMTLNGPNPGFKVTVLLQIEYIYKNDASYRDKVTIEH